MNPEVIRACTPLFLATIGGLFGVIVLMQPTKLSESQSAAGLGLAGTAIAGAAGLAQTTKTESTVTGQNAKVQIGDASQTPNENIKV
ncbi:hypothetical protein H6F96_10165 [Microcoleus sp. FACHB-53]|nr:hypothetical protein [Microcoleus sp. FACHB-53]